MRTTISVEGYEAIPKIIVEDGALEWGEDRIPITARDSYMAFEDVRGWATDLRREPDGRITAEIGDYDLEGCALTIYCTGVELNQNKTRLGGPHYYSKAIIRCLFPDEDIKWPEPVKEDKYLDHLLDHWYGGHDMTLRERLLDAGWTPPSIKE